MQKSINTTKNILSSYIHGSYISVPPLSSIESLLNATTGQIETEYFAANNYIVNNAVISAASGYKKWGKLAPAERSAVLRKAAEILSSRKTQLARMETLDTGRPITETNADMAGAIDSLHYFAGIAPSIGGQMLDLPGGSWSYTRREPLGVTAGIGAWNYPLQSAIWKSAPALAFGNSIIFKPSEFTPQTALQLAEIYTEAGVPNGVFNVVLGAGEVGGLLSSHDNIAKISFTGSNKTGKMVNSTAALTLKKVTMELGGKSAIIVFNDANLDVAVSGAMLGNWYSSGQVCSNGTRVFVQKEILPTFIKELVRRTKLLVIGDPLDPNTHIGPMINQAHMKRVQEYIAKGYAEGARLINDGGGERVGPPKGCFLSPAIFDNCDDEMTIVKEEIFGMVMCILPFDTEDEVIHRSNNSEYGLSAGIFTQNLRIAHRVSSELQVGTCWINNYNLAPVETPWGGYKQSGLGRENGLASVEAWTQIKSIYVEMNPNIVCPFPK